MRASRKRTIAPGHAYDHLMPKPKWTDVQIHATGKSTVDKTVALIQKMGIECQGQTSKLAQELKGRTLSETCENIWNFVYWHIQYEYDEEKKEQVRSPARIWAERQTGVDCDCYTLFISTLLANLGIEHVCRVTSYPKKPHKFSHIYPIVPVQGGHITIDCVTDAFDHEVPFVKKKILR